MANTSKCVLRLSERGIFTSTHCVPAQTEVNLTQAAWQGPQCQQAPGCSGCCSAAGCLLPRSCSSSPSSLAAAGPLAPLSAAHFQSHQHFTPLKPGSKVSLLTSAQVNFPTAFTAAFRHIWVLMYAFLDVCAAKGDKGPLLEHPFPYPLLRGFVPV